MKKVFIILLVSLSLSNVAFSQLKYGILAGVTKSLSFKDHVIKGNTQTITKQPNADYGYLLGGFIKVKAAMFLFQPELYLSTVSNTYQIETVGSLAKTTATDRNFNLEMPLLCGLKTGPFKFVIGPSGRLLMFNVKQMKGFNETQENNLAWSLQTGVGLDFLKFQANLRYEIGLSTIASGITVDGKKQSFDTRANQLLFSIGLAL